MCGMTGTKNTMSFTSKFVDSRRLPMARSPNSRSCASWPTVLREPKSAQPWRCSRVKYHQQALANLNANVAAGSAKPRSSYAQLRLIILLEPIIDSLSSVRSMIEADVFWRNLTYI